MRRDSRSMGGLARIARIALEYGLRMTKTTTSTMVVPANEANPTLRRVVMRIDFRSGSVR
jgi:hypothetical protein